MTQRLFALMAVLGIAGTVLGTVVYPPAKYGVETKIYFSIYDSNSPWQFYETAPAADDVKVRKDGGTAARATNAVTDLDHLHSLVLTATEMQAAVVTVDVNDESAPALFGSETIVIPTYGHESAWTIKDSNAIEDLIDPNGLFKGVLHDVSAAAPLATTADIPTTTEITTAVLAGVIDGTLDLKDVLQILLSVHAGKATVTDNGDTRTIAFCLQDGSTVKLQITAAEADGARSSGGTVN